MWYTALLLGLVGSLHCAGMCSPLLMAVTNLTSSAAVSRLVYNAGRIVTYGILGSIFSGAASFIPIAKYQYILSLLFGVTMMVLAFTRLPIFRVPGLLRSVNYVTTFVKKKFAILLSKKNTTAVFLMGTLNGLLPCGMTLVALSYCLLLRGPLDGFNFMLLFGLGTLPVMIGFAPVFLSAIRKLNLSLQNATTALMIFSGLILFARVFIYAGVEAAHKNVQLMDVVLCR